MKFIQRLKQAGQDVSPPSRGAWIEISKLISASSTAHVAPLAGGVD